jgi:hypothetical protein
VDAWHWGLVAVGAVAGIVAVLALVLGTRGQGKLAKMKDTRTMSAREAAAAAAPGGGTLVELFGKATVSEPLIAPGSGTRCVYYRHKVEQLFEDTTYESGEYGSYTRTTHEWRTVSDRREYIPFDLTDSSGSITVNPKDAEIEARETMSDSAMGFGMPSEGGGLMDAAKNLTLGAFAVQTGQRRQSEWVVPTGFDVYVLGDSVVTPEGPVVEKGDDTFILSWKSEEQLSKSFSWKSLLWIMGAVIAVVVAIGAIYLGFTNKTWFKAGDIPIAPIVVGVVVLAGLGLAIYSFIPNGFSRMQLGTPGGDLMSTQMFGTPGVGLRPGADPLNLDTGPVCPSCQMPLVPGVTKCPNCHWNLGPEDFAAGTPEAGGAAEHGSDAAMGIAGIAGGVAAAGLIGTAMPRQEPASPDPATSSAPGTPAEEAQVPAPPAEPNARIGVIQRDITISGAVAFKAGERVEIELESPDPQRPECRYVVLSKVLNQRFRLSDLDLFT